MRFGRAGEAMADHTKKYNDCQSSRWCGSAAAPWWSRRPWRPTT